MRQVEKQSIIIWFVAALFIFISLLIIFFIYIYPNIIIIEENKKNLSAQFIKYNTMVEKWLNFEDFNNLNKTFVNSDDITLKELLNSDYYKNISKKIDTNFYNLSVYWRGSSYELFKTDKKFIDYLNDNLNLLEETIKSDSFNNKVSDVSSVLPKYSNYIDLNTDKSLTDLKFISYVEKLLNSFYLKTTSSIWIKDILSVNTTNNTNNKLDSIYYIPLDLEITWTKLDTLNFLEYIKNTWNVEFKENDFVFSDKKWSTSQLSEVQSFIIKDYIDNSYTQRTYINDSIKEFLINTKQSDDIIKSQISINFYISSIEKDKIISKIDNVIWNNNKEILINKNWEYIKDEKTWEYKYKLISYNYTNLLNLVKKLNSNSNLNKNSYYKSKVNDIYLYLNNNDLKKDFQVINKEVVNADDLNSVYSKVMKYKEIFKKIDKELYSIVESLWIPIKDKTDDNWKIIENWFYPDGYIFE